MNVMIHKFWHFKTRFFETFGKVASYFKYDRNSKSIMVFKFDLALEVANWNLNEICFLHNLGVRTQ